VYSENIELDPAIDQDEETDSVGVSYIVSKKWFLILVPNKNNIHSPAAFLCFEGYIYLFIHAHTLSLVLQQ
jgi:hypothetical protein